MKATIDFENTEHVSGAMYRQARLGRSDFQVGDRIAFWRRQVVKPSGFRSVHEGFAVGTEDYSSIGLVICPSTDPETPPGAPDPPLEKAIMVPNGLQII